MKSLISLLMLLSFPALAAEPAPEPAPLCDSRHVTLSQKFVDRRIAVLGVAITQADFANMGSYFDELEKFMASCVPPSGTKKEDFQGQICNANCFARRAEVPLFMVSELPYIKSGNKVHEMQSSVAEAYTAGQRIIDQGLLQLSRMNFGSYEFDSSKGATSESFNIFLRQQAQLSAIKVRLMLSQGDWLYQNISRSRAETLKMKLQGQDTSAQQAGNNGTETYMAGKKYEEASWVIQEALLDLPDTDAFSSEYFELTRLKNDTIERIRSIQKGYLFLNIDPEVFTTKRSDDLLAALAGQMNAIALLEDRIDDIIKSWQAVKVDEDRKNLENGRVRDTRAIELKSHEIAQLNETADSIRRSYETALNENDLKERILGHEAEILERNHAINRLRFELEKARRQAQTQQEILKKQADLDLTSLAREAAREKRDEYRWMIDINLTYLNLDLQIEQLESEIRSLEDQVKIRNLDASALDKTIGSHKAEIGMHDAKIKELNTLIQKFEKNRSQVYVDSRKPLVMAICALGAQKAKLVGSAGGFSDSDGGGSCPAATSTLSDKQYWSDLLDIRTKFFGADDANLKKNIEALRSCLLEAPSPVTGSSGGAGACAAFGSMEKIARDTHKKEKEIWEQVEKPAMEARKEMFDSALRELTAAKIVVGGFKAAHTTITAVAGAIAAATAGTSVTVGVAGLGPMVVTEVNIGEKAKTIYEIAMDALQGITDLTQVEFAYSQDYKNLERAKAELEQALKVGIKQYEAGNLKELIMNRTLADITGQDLQMQNEILKIGADSSKFLKDKDKALADAASEAQRIDSEIERIKRDLDRMKTENSVIALDIQMTRSQIDQESLQIEALRLVIDGLSIQKQGISTDISRLTRLAQNSDQRRGLIQKTKSEVETLQTKADAQQQVIHELNDKMKEKMSLLTEAQLSAVTQILEHDTASLNGQIKDLASEISQIETVINEVDKKSLNLAAGMKSELDGIAKTISGKRQEILDLAKKPDTFDQQKEMFFVSQTVASDLTRGAGEYLRSKKEKMQYVNFLFNLYRSRLDTLSELKGKGTQADLVPYIRTQKDLMAAVQNCSKLTDLPFECRSDSLAFDESPVVIRKSKLVIPADSGFMQDLLSKGKARFEITAAAVPPGQEANYKEAIRNGGSFMQWDPLVMQTKYNMSVVNIVLAMEGHGPDGNDDASCDPRLIVRHLGFGVRYLPNGESQGVPTIAAGPERADVLSPIYEDGNALFNSYLDFFKNVDDVPETIIDPVTRQPRALRFLGAPLVGTYEVSFDAVNPVERRACFEKRNLLVGFNFTTPIAL